MHLSKITFLPLLLVFTIGASTGVADDVIPTNVWTAFGSTNTTINGEPAPVGAIIDAYDGSGVHCGRQFAGEVPGKYRFMSVYGDDIETPTVDEGCVYGETVTFEINGRLAVKLGPDPDYWVAGDTREMDLSIDQSFALSITGPAGGSGQPGQTVTYQVTVTNLGDGTDLVGFDVSSQLGWEIVDYPVDTYLNAGASKPLDVAVSIPLSTPLGTIDTMRVVAFSRFNASAWDDVKISTLVGQTTGLELSGATSGSGQPGDTVDYLISLTNLGEAGLTVSMTVGSSAGWTIVQGPDPTYGLAPFESEDIDLSLEIPENAQNGDVDTLTIIADGSGARGLIDTLLIVTTVTVNYGFTIAGPTFGTGDPGESVEYYPITVTNTGSLADQASFDWESSQGWTVQPPTSPTAEIPPGGMSEVAFTVEIPGSAELLTRDTLLIVVSSLGDPTKQDTLTIVTQVGEYYDVSVTGPDSGRGTPGSQVAYEITIYNEGSSYDSIAVEVSSSSSWNLGGLPDPVEYYPGTDGEIFLITVDIPGDAEPGDLDTLTIVATSLSDSDKTDTLIILTRVDEETAVDDPEFTIPGGFQLRQNYPNPFNLSTTIPFRLEIPGAVSLQIYDVRGRLVRTIEAGYLAAGEHSLSWDGSADDNREVASGVYFYRLNAGDFSLTRKMVLLK